MILKPEEEEKLISEVREEYIKEVKRRILERILNDQSERIQKYSVELSGELTDKFRELFPL